MSRKRCRCCGGCAPTRCWWAWGPGPCGGCGGWGWRSRPWPSFPDTLEERRLCFSAGADVWLPRPVDPEEAALLLWAMVRRYGGGLQAVVALGEAWLDEPARELRLPGKALPLPPREYAVLALLMAHPRRVFSRQEIMDRLWELGCESGPRSVDIYISRLRARCGGEWGFSIQTVRGLGYRLVAIPAPEGEREAREATSK